jgi:hypothetical protein
MAIPDARNVLAVVPDAGETWAFFPATPTNAEPEQDFAAVPGEPFYHTKNHTPGKTQWNLDDYILYSLITYQGEATRFDPVPVLGLLPDTAADFSVEPPLAVTLIEGMLWLRVLFDATIQRYRVWYAVYGWTSSDSAKANADQNLFATLTYDDAKAVPLDTDNWWVVPQHDIDYPVYSEVSLVWLTTTATRVVLDDDVPYLILEHPTVAYVQKSLGDTCCVSIVTLTSTTPDAGGYLAGTYVRYNAATKLFTNVESCYVLNLNP